LKSVADLIHAVIYGQKAGTSFIAIIDGWPSCDYLLQINAQAGVLFPIVDVCSRRLHALENDVLLFCG